MTSPAGAPPTRAPLHSIHMLSASLSLSVQGKGIFTSASEAHERPRVRPAHFETRSLPHRTILICSLRRHRLPFSRPLSLCHPLHAPSQLRLLYEAIPMAYLVEKAGGRSSDGRGSLLDIAVVDLDDRTQVPYHT